MEDVVGSLERWLRLLLEVNRGLPKVYVGIVESHMTKTILKVWYPHT